LRALQLSFDMSGRLSLLASCGLLSAAVILLFACVGWFAFASAGANGLAAASVAAGACWIGSLAALAVSSLFRAPTQAVSGVLAGTLVRTGIPLFVLVVMQAGGGPLVQAGVCGYIVIFFLFTLVVDTLLLLCMVRVSDKKKDSGQKDSGQGDPRLAKAL
jgi:hypothetical protein